MSGKLMGMALNKSRPDGSPLSDGHKLVLLSLCNHANDDGSKCFPKQSTIAAQAGRSVRQVRRILADLETWGAVKVTKSTGSRSRYDLDINSLPDASQTPDIIVSSVSMDSKTDTGHNSVPCTPDIIVSAPPDTQMSPLNVIERQEERQSLSVNKSTVREPQPYDLVLAMTAVTGAALSTAAKKQQCGIAKRLLNDGVTASDVTGITTWLHSQAWVKDGVSMNLIQSMLARWETAGKPTEFKAQATANRPTSIHSPKSRNVEDYMAGFQGYDASEGGAA